MTEIQQQLFDYASLNDSTAKLAKESAIEIKAREKAIWENILEIGNRLIEIKRILPHGKFETWIKLEFDWNKSTSSRYMKIAQEIEPKVARMQPLPNSLNSLYALASGLAKTDDEKTKEQILEEVEKATKEKSKSLTEKEIKEITDKYTKMLKEQDERIERYQQTQLDLMGEKDKLTAQLDKQKEETKFAKKYINEAINEY